MIALVFSVVAYKQTPDQIDLHHYPTMVVQDKVDLDAAKLVVGQQIFERFPDYIWDIGQPTILDEDAINTLFR